MTVEKGKRAQDPTGTLEKCAPICSEPLSAGGEKKNTRAGQWGANGANPEGAPLPGEGGRGRRPSG